MTPEHRVFVIGSSVLLPYRSENLIDTTEQFERIVFKQQSIIGELPVSRRDPLQEDGGALLGNYFDPGKATMKDIFDRHRDGLVWNSKLKNKKKSVKSVGESLVVDLAARALESAGITPDSFEEVTDQQKVHLQPMGESGKGLRYAVGITNSSSQSEIIIKAARAETLQENDALIFARAGLLAYLNTPVMEMLGKPGIPILQEAACATALFQIHAAQDLLRRGKVDIAIVGGFEIGPDRITPYLLKHARAMANYTKYKDDPTRVPRPGDIDADGMIETEGGAAIVLATEEAIKRLKLSPDNILAEVLSSAIGQEISRAVPTDKPIAMPEAIEEAIQDAGITKEQIDAAIFHGTGTVPGDVYDWSVWRQIYGLEPKTYKENFHDEPDTDIEGVPYVTLPKACYGHTLAASGALSSFTIFDMFKRQEVPATRNITKPHGMTVNLVHGENKKKEVDIGIVTAAGIEGTVAAVIYRRPPDEIPSYPQA